MPIVVRITKEEARRRLGNVPEEDVFFCNDGRVLHNLGELKDALETMSGELFSYHANEAKNDFTNWVRDVVRDETLARQLSKANSSHQAAAVVKERLNFLSSKA